MNKFQHLAVIFAVLIALACGSLIEESRHRLLTSNVPLQTCYNKSSTGACAECVFSYYLNQTDGKCYRSNPNCKLYYFSNSSCVNCFKGFNLINGFCIYNYLLDLHGVGCLTFLSDGECSLCSPGYYNNSGSCESIDPFCQTFNYTSNICVICQQNFSLNINRRSCVMKDEVSIGGLSNPFCTQFTAGPCTTCFQGYSLVNGNCTISTSSSVDGNCQIFDANHSCTQCYNGFYVSPTNWCLLVDPLCATYQQAGGACLSCYASYYLQNGSCVGVDPYCVNFNYTLSACTACAKGYYLYGLICVFQNQSCVTVNSIGDCTSCVASYYLQGGICHPVDPNCKIFDYYRLACFGCYTGYYLDPFNVCQLPPAASSNCASLTRIGTCASCYSSYYLQNGTCLAVDPQCRTFDYTLLKCTACYQGYALNATNTCVIPS